MMNGLSGQLVDAASLMLLGMLFVFLFLGALVGMIKLLQQLAPPVQQVNPPLQSSPGAGKKVSPQVLAAIGSAIHRYRQRHARKN